MQGFERPVSVFETLSNINDERERVRRAQPQRPVFNRGDRSAEEIRAAMALPDDMFMSDPEARVCRETIETHKVKRIGLARYVLERECARLTAAIASAKQSAIRAAIDEANNGGERFHGVRAAVQALHEDVAMLEAMRGALDAIAQDPMVIGIDPTLTQLNVFLARRLLDLKLAHVDAAKKDEVL